MYITCTFSSEPPLWMLLEVSFRCNYLCCIYVCLSCWIRVLNRVRWKSKVSPNFWQAVFGFDSVRNVLRLEVKLLVHINICNPFKCVIYDAIANVWNGERHCEERSWLDWTGWLICTTPTGPPAPSLHCDWNQNSGVTESWAPYGVEESRQVCSWARPIPIFPPILILQTWNLSKTDNTDIYN